MAIQPRGGHSKSAGDRRSFESSVCRHALKAQYRDTMQTITLKAHTGHDGLVKLEIPTDMSDREVEIVLVMHPLDPEPLDGMGYPVGYFEDTYGSFADEQLERNQPFQADVRDEIE